MYMQSLFQLKDTDYMASRGFSPFKIKNTGHLALLRDQAEGSAWNNFFPPPTGLRLEQEASSHRKINSLGLLPISFSCLHFPKFSIQILLLKFRNFICRKYKFFPALIKRPNEHARLRDSVFWVLLEIPHHLYIVKIILFGTLRSKWTTAKRNFQI